MIYTKQNREYRQLGNSQVVWDVIQFAAEQVDLFIAESVGHFARVLQ